MDPTANVKPHLPSLSAVTPFRSRPFIPITNDRHGPSYGRAVGGEERATHFPSAQAATSSNSGGWNDQNIPHSSGQRPESSQLIQGSRNGGSGLTMRAVLEPAPSATPVPTSLTRPFTRPLNARLSGKGVDMDKHVLE